MEYHELCEGLRGVAFTTPTPFGEDGKAVRHDELKRTATYLEDSGARVLIPCGNTGEYYSLSTEEREAIVESTVEAVGEGVSVVGGVGGSTKTATRLLAAYEAAGADGAMVMHPVHTYMHHRGIVKYYRTLLESTDLGIVLYKRGPELTLEHIADLVEYENVVGVKYAVNDIKEFSKAVTSTDGDVVWSNGIAERFAPSFAIEGAEGYTTGIGNFLPEETLELMDAIRSEEWSRAVALRNLLRPYEDLREETGENSTLAAANNVPVVKYGMELAGQYGGPVREPLVELSEQDKGRAEQYYERVKTAEPYAADD